MRLTKTFTFSITALKETYLIKRAKKGDPDSFGKLYLSYLDQIYRYIYFRANQETDVAEDITQEVFIKALEKIKNFKRQKGTFKAWLYAIARNSTIDYMRKKSKSTSLNSELVDQKKDPLQTIIDKEENLNAAEALKKLPKKQQEVLVLSFANRLSSKEISALIGKQSAAVRAIKHRALKNLKEFINHV